DGLALSDAFLTAIGRCAPPGNKPTRRELQNCRPYLEREWDLMPQVRVALALGRLAFDGVVKLLRHRGYTLPRLQFSYGFHHVFGEDSAGEKRHLLASYHPSRQNTQTGRLTQPMLDAVFATARALLKEE
ncbi:MAG: uracil-DNA glycosylase family protein, partial [Anaerolineae bacterium]